MKLTLEDFSIEIIQHTNIIVGGGDPPDERFYTVSAGCTEGDIGCCDSEENDDYDPDCVDGDCPNMPRPRGS